MQWRCKLKATSYSSKQFLPLYMGKYRLLICNSYEAPDSSLPGEMIEYYRATLPLICTQNCPWWPTQLFVYFKHIFFPDWWMVCVWNIFNQLLTYLPTIKSHWACCRWPSEALGSSTAQKMPAQSRSMLHLGSSVWSDGHSRWKPVQLRNLYYWNHHGFNLFH